jgi:hypothetical protein
MKKFAVLIAGTNGQCKRSLTMSQIEVLFVISAEAKIEMQRRKTFTLAMTFYGGEMNKAVKVFKLPNGYLQKFTIKLS